MPVTLEKLLNADAMVNQVVIVKKMKKKSVGAMVIVTASRSKNAVAMKTLNASAVKKIVAVKIITIAVARRKNKMIIKVLGTGCPNCKKMVANVSQAVKELNIEATIEKVENIQEIMAYGVMRLPAIVIDGQVKTMGRVLSCEEVKKYLL
jgi:small redox-active disulfide protein 2